MEQRSSKPGYAVRLFREDLNFSAAHISTYGDLMEGQHGHNYQLSIEIRGPLDEDGLVIDFRVVKEMEQRSSKPGLGSPSRTLSIFASSRRS